MNIDERRIKNYKKHEYENQTNSVIYWMNREMRIHDNWAFIHAVNMAQEKSVTLQIIYSLDTHFLGGIARQNWFKLERLIELCDECDEMGVEFIVCIDQDCIDTTIKHIQQQKSVMVVTDMSPLKIHTMWLEEISTYCEEVVVVDAHNIVPVWIASEKQEFSARTIRPKIQKFLDEFLQPFPKLQPLSRDKKNYAVKQKLIQQRDSILASLDSALLLKPGRVGSETQLKKFLNSDGYVTTRNNAIYDGTSGLSPYLHYGIIAPQTVARLVIQSDMKNEDKNSFLEEVIIRRELSDNFCYYNKNYDNFFGLAPWAQKTLNEHRVDVREFLYEKNEFEQASTHDDLWNASQREMVQTGKMHGYMRMYWAKKILEWTKTPEEAIAIAIYLNDTYEFDGRDPNGYVGILWSMGGLHDRPWFRRSIFGLVRYMARSGVDKKFNTKEYIARWVRNIEQTGTLY